MPLILCGNERTLSVLHVEPPGPENGDSIADTLINKVKFLGIMHTFHLIC
jgi:hypothetical protein